MILYPALPQMFSRLYSCSCTNMRQSRALCKYYDHPESPGGKSVVSCLIGELTSIHPQLEGGGAEGRGAATVGTVDRSQGKMPVSLKCICLHIGENEPSSIKLQHYCLNA